MTNQELINALTAQNSPDAQVVIHDSESAMYFEVTEVSMSPDGSILLAQGDETWLGEDDEGGTGDEFNGSDGE